MVKSLYEQVVDLSVAEREVLLARAEVDPAVRAEVRSLLDYNPDQTGSSHTDFLREPAAAHVLAEASRIGEQLGAWEIVCAISFGGMGEVFEARRSDGTFEGRAAIKILKRGMDSASVLQHFAQERQALARMSHPHIATLLDAGLSADGLPYFVMEYVEGLPIDLTASKLPIEQRLALFLQLADAVAYAHGNLLVHRDLKPGNVLVTAQGQVKLLDFGIAKALDPSDALGVTAGHAGAGGPRPFTPQYASPEQVRGEPVGTGTDIYSLGVLLYQLLTGLRPTGRTATTPIEIARSVLEEEPTRPSNLSPDLVTDPNWLATRKHLKGDLDNILLMALEKSVERRYSSVEALAQDIRNYLSGHPVSARARHLISQVLYKPGMAHLNRADQALAELAAAHEELVELRTQDKHPEIAYLLGAVDGQEAIVHESRDALDQALVAAQLAMSARRATLEVLPKDVEYRDALVTESTNLGRVLLRLQRDQEALVATQEAWDINLQLESEHAGAANNKWTGRLPTLATHHGRALRRAGHLAAALPVLERALAHWQQLSRAEPQNLDAARALAWMQAERAQALHSLGQSARAQILARDAFSHYQAPTGDPPQRRAGLLVQAQLAMAIFDSAKGNEPAHWKATALQLLAESDALAPLAGEHRAWLRALATKP